MTTSDSPTREEIYWGVCYQNALKQAEYYSDDVLDREHVARLAAGDALKRARKHGFPKGF